MNIEQILLLAFGTLDKEVGAIHLDLQAAVAKSVVERTRDAGENAQKHPVQSSTTLKESYHRAHAAVARLELKFNPVLGSAMTGLIAIAIAREYVNHVENAIAREAEGKREKGATGLYEAGHPH